MFCGDSSGDLSVRMSTSELPPISILALAVAHIFVVTYDASRATGATHSVVFTTGWPAIWIAASQEMHDAAVVIADESDGDTAVVILLSIVIINQAISVFSTWRRSAFFDLLVRDRRSYIELNIGSALDYTN